MPLAQRDLITFGAVQFEGVDQFVDRFEPVTASTAGVSDEPFEFSKVGFCEFAGFTFSPITRAHPIRPPLLVILLSVFAFLLWFAQVLQVNAVK